MNSMSMLRYYADDSPGLKITPVRDEGVNPGTFSTLSIDISIFSALSYFDHLSRLPGRCTAHERLFHCLCHCASCCCKNLSVSELLSKS